MSISLSLLSDHILRCNTNFLSPPSQWSATCGYPARREGLITTFTDFLEFEHFESFFIISFYSPLIGNVDISWKNIHLKLPPTQTSLYWTTLECKQHERELLMFSLMMRQNVPLYLLFTVVILQMKQIKISDQSANPRATCPVN